MTYVTEPHGMSNAEDRYSTIKYYIMNKLEQITNTDGWMLLARHGRYEHPRGIQVITSASANDLAGRFNAILVRFGMRKIPVYIGHPDDPYFSKYPAHMNTREYGAVNGLKACDEGIYVRISWNEHGITLLKSNAYKYLSPRWIALPIDGNDKVLEPMRLISIGLTNSPNLDVPSIYPHFRNKMDLCA